MILKRWKDFCIGIFCLALAFLFFGTANNIVPAIGRAIDRQQNVNSINCGLRFGIKNGDFDVGFTAKAADNVKDHPTAVTVDGH